MEDFRQFKNKQEVIKYLKKKYDITCRTTAMAVKWLHQYIPNESYYQDRIMKWIPKNVPKAFAWKAQAGPYCRQGIPDICCIVNGRYYGFEVKRPFIGVLSKIQEETINEIRAAGGRAYVVTYEDEVAEILQSELEIWWKEHTVEINPNEVERYDPCDLCENNQLDPCIYLEENDRSSCPKVKGGEHHEK